MTKRLSNLIESYLPPFLQALQGIPFLYHQIILDVNLEERTITLAMTYTHAHTNTHTQKHIHKTT